MESVLRFWGCARRARSNETLMAFDVADQCEQGAEPTQLRNRNRNRSSRGGRSATLILALVGAGLTGIARGQVVTEFPVLTATSQPAYIAAGPDGNLWFTEFSRQQHRTDHDGRRRHGVPHPHGQQPAVRDRRRPGRQPLVHRIQRQQDRPDHDRRRRHGVPRPHGQQHARTESRRARTATSGSPRTIGNKIGRITPAGVITEFPIPTAQQRPYGITAGPDGNLWFTEFDQQQDRTDHDGRRRHRVLRPHGQQRAHTGSPLARTATSGSPSTTATRSGGSRTAGVDHGVPGPNRLHSIPAAITAGPDGNLWFTEGTGNKIGRITTAGVITEFSALTATSQPAGIAAGPDGNLWFTEYNGNNIGRITTGSLTPQPVTVDAHTQTGSSSNLNGVLEPGEIAQVAPSWKNTLTTPQGFTGQATNLTGPAGPTYTIHTASADYGNSVAGGTTQDCNTATGDCYLMSVSGTRPVAEWDVTFTETLTLNSSVPGSIVATRTLHVGESFADVPTSNPDYAFIENLFHNGITGGCAGGGYCPSSSVTRAQMAVFLMKSKLGKGEMPPPATGTVFSDVPASNPFAPWIEQLAGFGITGGCGGGKYCPNDPVTRAQMAVFLLKTQHGSLYTPPACTGVFSDVPCPSQFANWIVQLFHENVTGGCGSGMYCPNNPVNRGQMAVFLVKAFGLELN